MSDTQLPSFKRMNLAQTNPIAGNKKRTWKSLKQITAYERTLPWKDTDVTCKQRSPSYFRSIF